MTCVYVIISAELELKRGMRKSSGKKKESGKMTSEEFRSLRNSYGMSQKEWADAVGISAAMVKLIETDRQACSIKTAEKVWEFAGSAGTAYRKRLDGLEEHILYDIFWSTWKSWRQKRQLGMLQNASAR